MPPKSMNERERAKRAFARAIAIVSDQREEIATVGWRKSATNVVITAPGKLNRIYVTKADGTHLIAINDARVEYRAFLRVRIVLKGNNYHIVGLDRTRESAEDAPDDPTGVPPHPHAFTGLSDTPNSYSGAALYFVRVNAAGNALELVAAAPGGVDSVNGQTGVVVLDPDDLDDSATAHKFVSAAELALIAAIPTQETVEDWTAGQLTGNSGRVQFSYNDTTGVLTAILDVSGADRYLYSTGADAWAEGTITSFARGLLDDSDAATMRATLGLVIGTNVQAYDAELAALAGLTSAADGLPYFTGLGTASLATFTSAARNLLDDADAATMRSTLGITAYDQETVEDFAGAMVSGNTETGITVTYDDGTGKLNFVVAAQDHGALSGLGDDDHGIYALLAGRSGGQALNGGTAANDDLIVQGTSHATRTSSYVIVQPNGGNTGFGTSAPGDIVHVVLNANALGGLRVENTNGGTSGLAGMTYYTDGGASERSATFKNAAATTSYGGDGAFVFWQLTARPISFVVNNATDPQLIILGSGKVGAGGLTAVGATHLGVKAGSSTNDAAVGGVLYVTTAQAGNVGTGEDDLASYSVPASTLSANGQSLWFEAWGTFANNTNSKTLRVRFGSSGTTLVFEGNAITTAAGGFSWHIRGRIVRTGAATQKGMGLVIYGTTLVAPHSGQTTALNQTLSGALTLKVTAEAVSNNDVLIEGFIVGYDDQNT